MTERDDRWLHDREALRTLVQQYARCIDERDIDSVEALFDPDGHVDGVRGSSPVRDYLAGLRAAQPAGTSMHVLGDPLIDLQPGADVARLDTYAVVHQVGAPGTDTHTMLGIRYIDEVVRVADADTLHGRWRIRHRSTTLLWTRSLGA